MRPIARYDDPEDKELEARRPIRTENYEPSRTKQSFKDELDVNNIIKKYSAPELKEMAESFEGVYGDFNQLDYQTALTMLEKAHTTFMMVPSKIRQQFDNNPGDWIDFATDPKNLQQMRDWGFAHPEDQPDEPIEVKVVETQQDTSNK